MAPSDKHFGDLLNAAERDLAALRLLWPALRRHRLGYTVGDEPYSVDAGCEPDDGPAMPVSRADEAADEAALIAALRALADLGHARRAIEARGEALAKAVLAGQATCPVCGRTADRLPAGRCPACNSSLHSWRHRSVNAGRSVAEWEQWRRMNR